MDPFSSASADIEQLDSGMGSSDMRSPEVKAILPDDDEEDEEEDESLVERLVGLTEMFPKEVRNFSYNMSSCLCSCVKQLYSVSCTLTWFFFSSSAILVAPILFEVERAQMEEAQRAQQKQVLLGPNAAISSAGTSGLPMAPPIPR